MGSKPSECWEKVVEDTVPAEMINGALLMALMDDQTHHHVEGEAEEDERLGCVIRSLEQEIGPSTEAAGNSSSTRIPVAQYSKSSGDYNMNCMDCYDLDQNVNGTLDDYGDDRSSSMTTWQMNDPFDWADMDMGPGTQCDHGIANWYLDMMCANEIGMVGCELDLRDYSYCYGDASIEHVYSPLWQET